MSTLLHDYTFANGLCEDIIGGPDWDCTLYGDSRISNGTIVLGSKKGGGYAQLPSGITQGSLQFSIEIWISTASTNKGWSRIFQIGHSNQNNSNSLALDRVANNFNFNNHARNIMLEYFPTNYPISTTSKFQAYTKYRFNNQSNLYIATLFCPGATLKVYVNGTKFQSASVLPFQVGTIDNFNYIGRSLKFHSQPGFTGCIFRIRVWAGLLTRKQIISMQRKGLAYRPPTLEPSPSPVASSEPTNSPSLSATISTISIIKTLKPIILATGTLLPTVSGRPNQVVTYQPTLEPTLSPIVAAMARSNGSNSGHVSAFIIVASIFGAFIGVFLLIYLYMLKQASDERRRRLDATNLWLMQENISPNQRSDIA